MTLRRDERGLTESVQYAVVFPLLVLLTLGILQAGIYLHSRNVAQRAATAATDAARGSYGTVDEAREVALDLAKGGGLKDVSVQVSRSATDVEAVVSGRAPVMIRIGVERVSETASAPRERVTQP